MSEAEFIVSIDRRPDWPPMNGTDDPEMIVMRLLVCLRDLDRLEARVAAAFVDTAVCHLQKQFNLDFDCSGSE